MGRPDVYRRIVSIFCFIGYVWHVICLKAKKPNDFGIVRFCILAEKEGFEPSRPVIFDLHP